MRRQLVLLALLAAPVPASLHAQGWIEPRPHPQPRAAIIKLRTEVSVRLTERVARVEVEEWFRNDGGVVGEGEYLYPLPGEAVFTDFSLFQGDQELRGEMLDATRARSIYEEIVRRNLDPALIELVGHGLLRARVFPINPGETRKVTLRYTQVLGRSGDALHFRYAAGIAGRGTAPVPGVRPVRWEGGAAGATGEVERAPLSFTLVADDAARFGQPFSPTHSVRVSRDGGRLTVRPTGRLDGSFSLFLPLASSSVGITLATHAPAGDDGYFMLTLSPGQVRAAAVPRDVVAVLDVSGSMAGSKMEQARQALHQLLGTLQAQDRFRLIAFNSTVLPYRDEWTPATAAGLASARRWVDGLEARGGTNISGALAEAFRLPGGGGGRLPIVLFVTDGLPTVGETDPERIARQAERERGAARVFAFGVGYDVNTYLLDRLTVAARGSTQYVEPDADVETAISTLAAKIQHPVLTDLRIHDAPVRLREIYPTTLPDLFAGEDLVLFGRYSAPPRELQGPVTLAGRRQGQEERFSTHVRFAQRSTDHGFIPVLWASRKIGALSQQIRLNGRNAEVEQEIRETALRYGLLSEFTAYLVQEPDALGRPGAHTLALESVVVTGAAASGRKAVMSAERSRAQREVVTEADAAAASASLAPGAGRSGERTVGGRVFREEGGVWKERRHNDSLRVVHIEPFSRAYFDLLQALPELKPVWRELPQVLVAGERVSVQVAPGGTRELAAAALARLVREFRGH